MNPPIGRGPAKRHDVKRLAHECIHCGKEPSIRLSKGFAEMIGVFVFDHQATGLALTNRCAKCGKIDEIPIEALARRGAAVEV